MDTTTENAPQGIVSRGRIYTPLEVYERAARLNKEFPDLIGAHALRRALMLVAPREGVTSFDQIMEEIAAVEKVEVNSIRNCLREMIDRYEGVYSSMKERTADKALGDDIPYDRDELVLMNDAINLSTTAAMLLHYTQMAFVAKDETALKEIPNRLRSVANALMIFAQTGDFMSSIPHAPTSDRPLTRSERRRLEREKRRSGK